MLFHTSVMASIHPITFNHVQVHAAFKRYYALSRLNRQNELL